MGLPNAGSLLLDFTSSTVIYVGTSARHGADPASAIWAIQKIPLDANGNPTSVLWASGIEESNFIWNSRTGYTYS